ncbi:hypothetical protein [Thermoplasma volcanium GSS1]|uniref:Uncharacterized protein n=1 Tax=Thermoplasma volcanium (strain ATCC 51530 / DSM 4299 / JCM 9571 / NBRC 15438 / GSS1) TaxID=273116 RepID=Q978N7_THEVO|nr:hypothetical protein [Thermoplasma volcanium]BAB60520.1 hypothetical protein [Thermoplasma volcanium GSS1]
MRNLAVIISSGKNEKEKVLTALTFANVAKKNKLFDDVKLILFGPSERLVAENDKDVMKLLDDFNSLGEKPLACQVVANNFNIIDDLQKAQNIKIERVGPIIKELSEKNYEIMTF